MINLSEEQQLKLGILKTRLEAMSTEEIKAMLVAGFTELYYQQNQYRAELKKEWGL